MPPPMIGATIPLVIVVACLVYWFTWRYIKRYERANLPFDYLERVGQLNFLGYGLLEDSPSRPVFGGVGEA